MMQNEKKKLAQHTNEPRNRPLYLIIRNFMNIFYNIAGHNNDIEW